MTIRPATARDLPPIHDMLRAASLPVEGVGEDLALFRVACDADGTVRGVIGIEMHSSDALLRSLVVDPAARNDGVAARLVEAAIVMARDRRVADMYLLTTDAAGYFTRLGFRVVARDRVPAGVRASREFASLCPADATVMRLQAETVR